MFIRYVKNKKFYNRSRSGVLSLVTRTNGVTWLVSLAYYGKLSVRRIFAYSMTHTLHNKKAYAFSYKDIQDYRIQTSSVYYARIEVSMHLIE